MDSFPPSPAPTPLSRSVDLSDLPFRAPVLMLLPPDDLETIMAACLPGDEQAMEVIRHLKLCKSLADQMNTEMEPKAAAAYISLSDCLLSFNGQQENPEDLRNEIRLTVMEYATSHMPLLPSILYRRRDTLMRRRAA